MNSFGEGRAPGAGAQVAGAAVGPDARGRRGGAGHSTTVPGRLSGLDVVVAAPVGAGADDTLRGGRSLGATRRDDTQDQQRNHQRSTASKHVSSL